MDHIQKKPRSIGLVTDETSEAPKTNSSQLTLKLLDDYVAKLVQFERQALVGQEKSIQLPNLSSLSDLRSPGKSAFKFKKAENDREKLAEIIAPMLKKTERS